MSEVERPVITTVDTDTGFHVIVDSIVSGMVRYEVSLTEEAIKQGLRKHGWIPATPAEIMDAHPKCGECKHYDPYSNMDGVCLGKTVVVKTTDYCRHWEAKT